MQKSQPDSIIKTDTGHIEFRKEKIKVIEYKYCLYCGKKVNNRFCNGAHRNKYYSRESRPGKKYLTSAKKRFKKYLEDREYTIHYFYKKFVRNGFVIKKDGIEVDYFQLRTVKQYLDKLGERA